MAESMAEAVVCRRRAMPMKMSLQRGRKGLPDAERELFDAIADATGGNGIPVHDGGFDSEEFVGHAIRSGRRAVVRMKTMTRDLFGTGRSVEEDMATAPHVRTTRRSPTRRVDATVGWRSGDSGTCWPCARLPSHISHTCCQMQRTREKAPQGHEGHHSPNPVQMTIKANRHGALPEKSGIRVLQHPGM